MTRREPPIAVSAVPPRPRPGRGARLAVLLAGLVLVLAACSGGPILANAPARHPIAPEGTPGPVAAADPVPIVLPADDAPHHRLTEWWYYTGHLQDETGAWYGFEYVIFRAERGDLPVSWASHLAITDEAGQRFVYAQRSQIGPSVGQGTGASAGFDFVLTGADLSRPETFAQPPWTMSGSGGRDHLAATLSPAEAIAAGMPEGMALALTLAATKPAALHDGDGWIDFGPAGGSYYYSRTSMTAAGTLTLDGRSRTVRGEAWFDHQWGDFIAVGAGGWDWFAVELADGTDLTLSLVRDGNGGYPLVYGTLVARDGSTTHLPSGSFTIDVLDHWTSPRTGATYPSGWRIRVPSAGLDLTVTPTVRDQELDTRPTTGVIYWEGSQLVRGTHDGQAVAGRGYVELTGYVSVTASR
jgi:predicted secreted hydrolase